MQYYAQQSHVCSSDGDFAKFVTPYALKPVADKLRGLYQDDEDFANSVLMIVHQIPYKASGPEKYPVETIVANSGDCDLLSLIAASIMKAGGLDVVLLYYKTQAHMNVGVHLSHPPTNTRGAITYVNSTIGEGKYYVAECTGLVADWRDGWRVGECSDTVKQAPVAVITLENSEQIAPEQVAVGFATKAASNIVAGTSIIVAQGSTLTVQGHLTPNEPNENVTIFVTANGSPLTIVGTALTKPDGKFEYNYNSTDLGLFIVRVSWAGNENYDSAMTQPQILVVLPTFVVPLVWLAVIIAFLSLVTVIILRKTRKNKTQQKVPGPVSEP